MISESQQILIFWDRGNIPVLSSDDITVVCTDGTSASDLLSVWVLPPEKSVTGGDDEGPCPVALGPRQHANGGRKTQVA